MKHLSILTVAFILGMNIVLYGKTLKVGTGQTYTTIQSAISDAAATGDTIKVMPGTYSEAITINKNVVIQGSGYETTKIISNSDPTVKMSGGKLMWFSVTSSLGDGIQITAGSVTNCVVVGCTRNGVYFANTGSIKNSILFMNAASGITGYNTSTGSRSGSAVNCISWLNGSNGFYGMSGVTYCDGSINYCANSSNVVNSDPMFTSGNDFHIPPTSPCYQTGNPGDLNPDGSQSSIGYFGGSDCPIYPVVTRIKIVPLGNGQVQIQATAQANY